MNPVFPGISRIMAQYLEKEDSNREVLNADPNEIRRLRRQAKKEIENSQKNEKGGNKPVMGKPQKKLSRTTTFPNFVGPLHFLAFSEQNSSAQQSNTSPS